MRGSMPQAPNASLAAASATAVSAPAAPAATASRPAARPAPALATAAAPVAAAPLAAAVLAAALLAASLLPAPAAAQGGPRGWGLAGAATAAARGLDAVDANPACLALAPPSCSLALATAAVDLHNNAFSLARYNEIAGAELSEADKRRLLADIPDGGFALRADARASAVGIGIGSVALTSQALGGASGRLAKDFFDLVLMGNPVDSAFDLAGTSGEGFAVGAVTLTAAAPLATTFSTRLAAGVNLRYLRGIYELHVEEATGGLTTTLEQISGEARASYLTAAGGAGWAVDAGLALQAPRGWTFGLALDNAVSRLDWDRNCERHVWSARADTINATHENLDAQVAQADTSYGVAGYGTTLPARLRLGAAKRWERALLAVDVAQGLAERAGTTRRTQVAAGVEWRAAGWLRPRLGVAAGGGAGVSAAAGLGVAVGPWRLDLAAINRGRLLPGDAKGLGVACGTRLEF